MCVRHADIHRREARNRARRLGCRPWTAGGKGRPPLTVKAVAAGDADVVICESILADALEARAVLNKRIARLKAELTQAKREARSRADGWT